MQRLLAQTIILLIALKLQGIMDLLRRYREGDPRQNKRVRNWAGSEVLNELFCIIFKMRPLYKLRQLVGSFPFFFKLTGTANAS